jgi:hypothetical protein
VKLNLGVEIPDDKYCNGCQFLRINTFVKGPRRGARDYKCALFQAKLSAVRTMMVNKESQCLPEKGESL